MALKTRHDPVKVVLILITILLFVVVLILNRFASNKTLFPNDVGSLSRKYKLDITPASFVFPIIWSTIYFWQAVWLLYSFVFLFRRTSDGSLIYRKIDVLNNGIFIGSISNSIGMILWLFFWTYEYLAWSFVTLSYLTLSLYVSFYISLKTVYMYHDDMKEMNLKVDIWLMRILIQNGLALFLTWVTIASNLNMATFLTYDLGVEYFIPTTIALLIVFVLIVFYFVIENFVWQKYLLYVFTPWVVILVGLSGSLYKNWLSANPTRNNIITLIMLVCSSLLFVGKIVMFVLYHTYCRPSVDKKESHKLLQAKQNRANL